jgi:hypothetical protein
LRGHAGRCFNAAYLRRGPLHLVRYFFLCQARFGAQHAQGGAEFAAPHRGAAALVATPPISIFDSPPVAHVPTRRLQDRLRIGMGIGAITAHRLRCRHWTAPPTRFGTGENLLGQPSDGLEGTAPGTVRNLSGFYSSYSRLLFKLVVYRNGMFAGIDVYHFGQLG